MGDVTVLLISSILAGIFLVVAGALLWQELKSRRAGDRVYVLRHAADFIWERLDVDARARLGRKGVRTVLEWEVYYLQGLAQDDRSQPVTVVAGGIDASVEYIVDRIAAELGVSYAPKDVSAVLAGEAAYLETIGAVGEPVAPDEVPGGEET